MTQKRFNVELGTGIDLHGRDVTRAACRAVKNALLHSCHCGLVEILDLPDTDQVDIDVLVACPNPDQVDLEKVKSVLPFGRKNARAVVGGMLADGMWVEHFGAQSNIIVVANAAVTVSVRI